MQAIIARDIEKKHPGGRGVSGLSFHVDLGEVVGLVGPNGAGKTTTMRLLSGFDAGTRGQIELCGQALAQQPLHARARMGYMPEGAPLWPELTPLETLRMVASVRGLPHREARMALVVEQTRIQSVLTQVCGTLSKGYRRRVALALALLPDPDILVLDEPTDGLDPNQKHAMRGLILELGKTKAILISTHLLEEIPQLCSRIIVLHQGHIVADGSPETVAGGKSLAVRFAELTEHILT